MLRIALPNKGSLSEGAVSVVSEAGYACGRSGKELAKLDSSNDVEFFFLRPRDIAVYDYSNILFTAALGFALFGQVPDLWSVLGFVLIVLAAIRLHRGSEI